MTSQESFKRRIRARMAKTGERYAAARRQLIEQAQRAQPTGSNGWAAPPEMSQEAIVEGTGRGWDEWVELIEGWVAADPLLGHPEVARRLEAEGGINAWWSQGVTVGWERITGRRLPYQRADGTFTAGKSRQVPVEAPLLRALLFDDEARADLFPGEVTEVRSKPTSKTIRLLVGPGVAVFSLAPVSSPPASTPTTRVTIAHERLPTYDQVEAWKDYWTQWLDGLAHAGAAADAAADAPADAPAGPSAGDGPG